jgi:hypothetical protein
MKAPAIRALALTTGVLLVATATGCVSDTALTEQATQEPPAALLGPMIPMSDPDASTRPYEAPEPSVEAEIGTAAVAVRGKASWYCNSDDGNFPRSPCHRRYPDRRGKADLYAAACASLREALGVWRGRTVLVSGNGSIVRVKLIDHCESTDKVIDLYRDAFDALDKDNGGVIDPVIITFGVGAPTIPPTDQEG